MHQRWMTLALLIAVSLCSLVQTVSAQTKDSKVAAWATVPGGKQVWLRPGIDAYEHDTGLVRDTRTGVKSQPITPQSLAYNNSPNYVYPVPVYPVPVAPVPPPRSPYGPQPYAMPTTPPPAYTPYSPYYRGGGGYDWGPNNVYYGQPCNGCGAKLGSPGSINGRWTRVQ